MAVDYMIDTESDLWLVVCSGFTTGEEYLESLIIASEEDAFHWNIDLLLDLSLVSEFDIGLDTFERIKAMEDQASKMFGPSSYKIAAITRGAVDRLNIELYSAMMKETKIEVGDFHTLEDALKWLGRLSCLNSIEESRTTLLKKTK
jgi:hypothetical protein